MEDTKTENEIIINPVTEIKVDVEEKLSDQFEAFYKTFSDEVDKKFSEIEIALNETKQDLILVTKNKLNEVDNIGRELKLLENGIFIEKKKNPEDMIRFKAVAESYMAKCENLDDYMASLKQSTLDQVISIDKKGIRIESKKNKHLKDLPKLKGESILDLKWAKIQKKSSTNTEEDNKIDVTFSSCWNDFHSLPLKNDEINEIYLEIHNFNSNTNWAIGITNEEFSGTSGGTGICFGCQTGKGSFCLKKSTICNETTVTTSNITIPDTGILYLCMIVDCVNKLLTFKIKNVITTGPFNIKGRDFKVTFAQCSSGRSTYKFIENFN
jgi:hypothetical protein